MMGREQRYRTAEQRLWAAEGGETPRERVIRLRSTGTDVRVQEVGAGPLCLFVHGASNSGTSWAPLVARLSGVRCAVLDRPGCGLSPPLPRPLDSIEALASVADDLVVDVLDALDAESADVVSTSFGGYFALRGAAAHPRRIRRLVHLGWTVGAPVHYVPVAMRLASIRWLGRLMTSIPPNRTAVRAILRQAGLRDALRAGRISLELIDWFLALLRDTDTMRNELDAGPRVVTPVRGMNAALVLGEQLLGQVEAPARFLWGEHDPFGGEPTARELVAQLPSAELTIIPGAGHAVWLDDPTGIAAQVAKFLAA